MRAPPGANWRVASHVPSCASSTATRSAQRSRWSSGATVDNAAGVIAEAGFTSIADLVAENYSPLNLLVSQKFDALAKAKLLRAPALFMHGTADRYVPPLMSEKLYAAAPQPKKLHMIEGANHGNWNGAGLDEYRRVIHEFVRCGEGAQDPAAIGPR